MSTSATVRWASGVAQAAARASAKAQEAAAAAQEAAQEAEQAAQAAAALVEKLMAVEGAEAAVAVEGAEAAVQKQRLKIYDKSRNMQDLLAEVYDHILLGDRMKALEVCADCFTKTEELTSLAKQAGES